MFSSPYLPYLYLALSTYLIGSASPGPATLSIMLTSMRDGRQKGLALACGITVGSFMWGIFAAFGLGGLMTTYAQIFILLKIAGGLYLFWLSYKALRASFHKSTLEIKPSHQQDRSLSAFFLQGLALHLTNPKAVLVWGAIITLGMPPQAEAGFASQIVLLCSVMGIFVFTGYAFLFSNKRMVSAYIKSKIWIERVMAAFFGFAGFKVGQSALDELECAVSENCG